ncbi:MAG: VCBS repeat-containing protein, partial [Armatimonadota bacterium]
DGVTGVRETALYYRAGHHRHYGFFGAYPDASGGGTLFVVIGDFSGHVDVLSYRDGELRLLWMTLFDPQSEQGIDRRFTINRVLPDPIADVNGDGARAILLSVFNVNDDQRWHVVGYDLLSGAIVLDLPDRYLSGLADVDGDGREELFCEVLRTRAEPTYAPLELVRLRAAGAPEVVWRANRGRWSFHNAVNQPLDRWWGQTLGNQALALRRTARGVEFFVSLPARRGAEETLEAWMVNRDGTVEEAWGADAGEGTELEVCATDPDGEQALLLARSQGSASLRLRGVTGDVVCARRRGAAAPCLALAKDGKGQAWLVAADISRRVSLLRFERGRPQIAAEFPGRPMSTQGEWAPRGLAAGDLDGDGADEVLFAQETPRGAARLVAMGLDGHERWHCDFPSFSGRLRAWNMGGMTCWIAGRFRDRGRLDVAVSLRRSIMHSDETYMLDGTTGEVIWRRDVLEVSDPPHTRGFGGEIMAAADVDGDGLDELILCYPAELSVTNGASGEVQAVYNMGPIPAADMPGDMWVIGGVPEVADLDGDGRLEILWTRNQSLISAFTLGQDGLRMTWHSERDQATAAQPAITRLDGGHCVIGAAGFPDGFRALDAANGETRWIAPTTDTPVSNTIATDWDGDGRTEFIFGAGSRLHARRADNGEECWALDLPGAAAQILDVQTGGQTMVVVATSAGELLVVKPDG